MFEKGVVNWNWVFCLYSLLLGWDNPISTAGLWRGCAANQSATFVVVNKNQQISKNKMEQSLKLMCISLAVIISLKK